MDLMTLRQWMLVMHLSGLVCMAGTTVTEYVLFCSFKRLYKKKGEASQEILQLMSGLGIILLAGGVLLVLSGIGLVSITKGFYLHQLWLRLKLLLILLLPLNGMLVGSPQINKLKKLLSGPEIENHLFTAEPAMTKLTIFYTVQILMFLAIMILAVFKVP